MENKDTKFWVIIGFCLSVLLGFKLSELTNGINLDFMMMVILIVFFTLVLIKISYIREEKR